MGIIYACGQGLRLEGEPPYKLPDFNQEFLDEFLTTQPGSEVFVGEVMKHLSRGDKTAIKRAARTLGGATYAHYCAAASKWAAVVNPDNKWHLQDFRRVYQARVDAAWAHEVIITDANIRFVTSPCGLLSFPEFQYVYGEGIMDHICERQAQIRQEFEQVKKHITAELSHRQVTMVNPQGQVVTRRVTVLDSLEPTEWLLPPGYQFLAVEDR